MTVVRLSRAMTLRRPLALLCALVAALALSACSLAHHPHVAGGEQTGQDSADANNNGAYVFAGPITYQLQISRELNQYSIEDSQYVKGLPSGTTQPGANQIWYGVFLWAKNQTNRTQTVSDNFEIEDTQHTIYRPIKLNPALNPFAWTAQTLPPLATEPGTDTIMSHGPTQGGELLFKVSSDVFSNRPLTLYILGANNQKIGAISLNL